MLSDTEPRAKHGEREETATKQKQRRDGGERESRLPMASERAFTRRLSPEFEIDLIESRESLADEIKINDL